MNEQEVIACSGLGTCYGRGGTLGRITSTARAAVLVFQAWEAL